MFLLLASSAPVAADDCSDCFGGILPGWAWCVEPSSYCYFLVTFSCTTAIHDSFNCPKQPEYPYNATFAHDLALPYIAAAYGGSEETSTICLENNVPSTTFEHYISVNCSQIGLDSDCTAYTATDKISESIIVSFTGTVGSPQLLEQFLNVLLPMKPFYTHGKVFPYFYDAFYSLWNGGLRTAINELQTVFPSYNISIFGHSLGAAEATLLAAHLLENQYFDAESIRLTTFGEPRPGDKDFAEWFEENLPNSFRVIHKNDLVSTLPPFSGDSGYWHHRFGVWYDNDMTDIADYEICTLGDGYTLCNNGQGTPSWDDHNVYFNVNISAWAAQGCPAM